MKYDNFGQAYISSTELCEVLYKNPDIDLSQFFVEDSNQYNTAVRTTFSDFAQVKEYRPYPANYSVDIFHQTKQKQWHMPAEYANMNIAQWLLDQCRTQEELQRVGQELLLYQERDLFPLLRQLKYVIDTWRSNNIVWGVGRGSSVASYVLYLIGVHRINSMYYDLDITEFLR
jgi:DNA polymerase III alpha subunit